jgi:tetratricopeptide (TPR) repeat protein
MADEQSILDPEIERLSERLQKDPESLVFAPLADAYRRSGLIEEAIDVLRKGMDKHPNYASAYIVLGRCYQDQKMHELARSEYEKALEVDPRNFLASRLYASVLVPLGKKKEAVERYRRLLEIDPDNAEIRSAIEDLGSEPEAEEPKDLSTGSETGFMTFGDIGKEIAQESKEEKRQAPGPMFGERAVEPMEEEIPDSGGLGVGAEATTGAEAEQAGRSPFDFGTILESASVEPEPKKPEMPPGYLEPTSVIDTPQSSRRRDFGTFDVESAEETPTAEPAEEIVLPKPTGKPMFATPPTEEVSRGGAVDKRLAEIYVEHGFKEKAIGIYERLIEKEPSNAEYKKRLAAIKGGSASGETRAGVFPSEILEPIPEIGPEGGREDGGGGFSEAATPEGDQTISLTDLFTGENRNVAPDQSVRAPEPVAPEEERKPRKPPEQPKGGFESFQSWLDGLGK